MSRTATGAITITDIADGGSPISAFLTNENHTFASSPAGDISSAERLLFTTLATVFVGINTGTFKSTPVTATVGDKFKFSYGTTTSSAADWAYSVNTGTGAFTITATPTGTTNKSTLLTVPIIINDGSSTLKTISLTITLTKAIEGSGGQIVQVSANKQFYSYDAESVLAPTSQGNVVIGIETQGNVGSIVIKKSVDGGVFSTLVEGTGVDQGLVVSDSSVTISPSNFDNSQTMTIRVSGSSGGSDSVSLVRVRQGDRGASALIVTVQSNDGNVFKNNTGSDKTITCDVYDTIDGSSVLHVGSGSGETSVNFNWQRADAGGTATDVNVATGTRNVVNAGGDSADGLGANTLVVEAADIADNSSTQFSCIVTVTEN